MPRLSRGMARSASRFDTAELIRSNSDGRSATPARSAAERRVFEYGHALDERADHSRLTDRARPAIEQVPVQDREIGQLAGLQRPGLRLEVVDVRRPRCERGERVHQLDPFIGEEHLAIAGGLAIAAV